MTIDADKPDEAASEARQADLDLLMAMPEVVTVGLVQRLDLSARAETALIDHFLGAPIEDLYVAAFGVPGHQVRGVMGQRIPGLGKAAVTEIREALMKLSAARSFDGVSREEIIGRILMQEKQIEALVRELSWRRGDEPH